MEERLEYGGRGLDPRRPRAPRCPGAWLLLALLGLFATPAHTSAATTFVSNTGQPSTAVGYYTHTEYRAQQFTAGNHAAGYRLSEIVVSIGKSCSIAPAFALHESITDANGLEVPGPTMVALTGSAASLGEADFTPANATILTPATKYFVVFKTEATATRLDCKVNRTLSSNIDSGAASGWDIAGHAVFSSDSGSTWRITGISPEDPRPAIQIAVTGTVVSRPSPVTFSDDTQPQPTSNTPPAVAILLADQAATVGASFTYVVPADAFTDVDGDPLAYTAALSPAGGLPGWLTFTTATRTFTGTPDPGDGGTVNVTVTASDGTAAAMDEFALTVLVVAPPSTLQAWTSRFGRTVATHVTDAVGERLRASPGQDSHVTVGGYRLPLGQHAAGGPESTAEADTDPLVSLMTGLASMVLGPGATRLDAGGTGTDPWAAQPEADSRLRASHARGLSTFRLRDVFLGSSFRLTLGTTDDAGTRPSLTAWGRVAGTQFDGHDGELTLDGNVLTGTLGVDGEWDRWLAGVTVSHSRGDGAYTVPTATTNGALDNALTSIHPYLRYAVTERLAVWGMLGYGWGDLSLQPGTAEPLETDTTLLMGAFGGRGILLAASESGGFQLATRTDAMLTRTTSDAVTTGAGKLESAEADAHRLRLVLEGSRGVTWPEGRTLTPTLEIGLRHDWGDAETGFGLELGGRVQYADPRLGLTIEGAVRGLLAHEDSDYQEWGASGSLRIAPGQDGQGLSLTLAPTWGAASSGIDGLWSKQTTAGLAPQGARPSPTAQLNAEIGYGIPAPFGTGLLTPYAGTVLSDGAARTYRLGTRWTAVSGLDFSLEGQRQDPAGDQPVNQGIQLQVGWGF